MTQILDNPNVISCQTEAEWQRYITEFKAMKAVGNRQGPADRAIWFETSNFGWILSPAHYNGKRRILVQF